MLVFYPDASFPPPADIEQAVLGADVTIELRAVPDADEVSDADWAKVDVLIVGGITIDGPVMDKLERCRGIVCSSVGTDHVDLAGAGARGLAVANVPDFCTGEVADQAMALMLDLARGVEVLNRRTKSDDGGLWFQGVATQRRLKGRNFAVVGMGPIGLATARRAAAFEMTVGFYDPFIREGLDTALGLRRFRDLDEMLAWADVVSLHAALSDATRNMIDRGRLAVMKSDAVLINVGRGGLLDLDALHDALKDGRLGAAGLDVLPTEPPDPSHRLLTAWAGDEAWLDGRLLITPHAAYNSPDSNVEVRHKAAERAAEILNGETPLTIANARLMKRPV